MHGPNADLTLFPEFQGTEAIVVLLTLCVLTELIVVFGGLEKHTIVVTIYPVNVDLSRFMDFKIRVRGGFRPGPPVLCRDLAAAHGSHRAGPRRLSPHRAETTHIT